MPDSDSGQPIAKVRRRAVRLTITIVLGLTLLYLALPWLVPNRLIASVLVGRLESLMRRSVQVDSVDFGYGQGLSISGLRIARRAGFGSGSLLAAEEVSIPLSSSRLARPLKLLSYLTGISAGPFDAIHIRRPQCWVVADERGALNISDLNDRGGARLPARLFELSQLTLSFQDLRSAPSDALDAATQQIILPNLTCRLAPTTGRVDWVGGLESVPGKDEGNVAVTGDITSPRLSSDVTLGGGGSIQWRDLDLNQIPRMLLPLEQLEGLEGSSNGTLEVQVSADLVVNFAADVHLAEAQLQLSDGRRWPTFAQADLALAGRWDPQAESLEISRFEYETPAGLIIRGREPGRPAITIDPTAEQQVSVTLAGQAEIRVLQAQLANLDESLLRKLDARGPCRFEFDFSRNLNRQHYRFSIDASRANIEQQRYFVLPAGETKRLDVSLSRDLTEGWRLQQCEMALNDSSLRFAGDWPVAAGVESLSEKIRQWVAKGRGELEVKTADLGNLFERIPLLGATLAQVTGRGPVLIRHQFTPGQEGLRISGQWHLGRSTVLKIGDTGFFTKSEGKELTLEYNALLPQNNQMGNLDDVGFELRYGRTQLKTVGEGAELTIAAKLPSSKWDRDKLHRGTLQASLSSSLAISDIEDGLTLFPGLGEHLTQRFPTGHSLSGNCQARLDLNGAVIHRQPVLRLHLEVDADQLSARLGERFRSTPDDRCQFELDYSYDARRQSHSQLIGLAATLSGGRFRALSEWSGRNDVAAVWPSREVAVAVEFDDLRRFLTHWPAVQKRLAPYGLSGGGELALKFSREKDVEHWKARADLTATNLPATEDGWTKPAGVPATLVFDGRLKARRREDDSGVVSIDRLDLLLGSSALEVTSLTAEIGNLDPAGPAHGALDDTDIARVPFLGKLVLAGRAEVKLEPPWPVSRLNRRLDQWLSQYSVDGRITTDFTLDYDGSRWKFEGQSDATTLAFDASPRMSKADGLATSLEFSLRSVSDPQNDGWGLRFAGCELRVGRFSASVIGDVIWHGGASVLAAPRSTDLALAMDLPDLSLLRQVWPGLSGVSLSGGVSAAVAVAGTAPGWPVYSALLAFNDARLDYGVSEMSADGAVQYDNGRWQSDSLRLGLGPVRALLSGTGCLTDADEPFELTVGLSELDRNQTYLMLQAAADDLAKLMTNATGRNFEPSTLTDALIGNLLADRLHADALVRIDKLHWPDDARHVVHTAEELVSSLTWRAGDFDWQLRGALGGGLLQAQMTGRPGDYELQCVLAEALPDADIERWLHAVFPGLDAVGSIDYSYVSGTPPVDWAVADDPPQAFGELIVRGGTLRGKAAPNWVTSVFPRLNLAAFDFDLMHDWFSVYADGRVQHQAVFQGKYYHVYASGGENGDGTMEYEIGIDLLGGLDSPYWATRGGGRIPLFVSINRVGDNGELLEESVKYEPLELVKALLWGANPIHTAYLALRKRIMEGRARD